MRKLDIGIHACEVCLSYKFAVKL